MGVIVTANYKGETFEVEIFRDGDIDFLDRDLQYEQALAEFYPPGSPAVQLHEEWYGSPVGTIIEYMDLSKEALFRLTADFAEHVLHLFESVYREDGRPRAAIEAARDFLDGKIDRTTLQVAEESAATAAWDTNAAAYAVSGAGKATGSETAAWAAARAAWGAAWRTESAQAACEAAAQAACEAAAHSASSNAYDLEFKQAYDIEVAWQIRRFVDCMEAVGLGKDWPDLGATT